MDRTSCAPSCTAAECRSPHGCRPKCPCRARIHPNGATVATIRGSMSAPNRPGNPDVDVACLQGALRAGSGGCSGPFVEMRHRSQKGPSRQSAPGVLEAPHNGNTAGQDMPYYVSPMTRWRSHVAGPGEAPMTASTVTTELVLDL